MGNQQSYQIDGIAVSWFAFKKKCKECNIDLSKNPHYKPQYRGNPKKKPIFNCESRQVWVMN